MGMRRRQGVWQAAETGEAWALGPRGRSPRRSPEQALWLGVLDEALHCALGVVVTNGVTHAMRAVQRAAERQRAADWIAADAQEIGSFQYVCDVLDLDAGRIRARLATAIASRRGTPVQKHPVRMWVARELARRRAG